MLTRTRRAVPVVVMAVLTAACGGAVAEPGSSEPPRTTPPPPPASDPITVDFAPEGGVTALDNGWTVQHCEGEAPLLCVRDEEGKVLGTVEFGSYPGTDAIAEALAEGAVVSALEAMVAEQHEAIAADRAEGCGSEYVYRPEPSTHTTVGGEPAVVYGFSGIVDGREIERHRSYYTVHGGQIWIVNATAAAPEGCMALNMGEFIPADLATFEPYLARIAAGSDLGAGTAIVDGIVVGVDGGLEGGLLYLLWAGGKQRIQPPAALTEADVVDLQLAGEPAVAFLTVVDGESQSYFAVVPPDGPEARLHIVVDGIVRQVLVQQVEADLVAGIPDLDNLVLGGLRPARSAAG